MKTITLTKGLPACGKTTWAKKEQELSPNTVRVNKDDLRAMLHNGAWSKGREQFVLKVRDFIVEQSLKEGHNVIVDDTNLAPKHEATMQAIANRNNAFLHIKDFTDISVEECIKRDAGRPNYVGERVIKNMYKQFLKPAKEKVIYDPTLGECIICDIDGTLALFGNKNPYERDFENDELNKPIADLIAHYANNGIPIRFFSGRKESFRDQTENWLFRHGIFYSKPYMRKDDDVRKDSIVKEELYDQYIRGMYNVLFVLDDRDQVVDMWRDLGLTCLQVAEGDF